MTDKKQNDAFPMSFIVTGILICCFSTISKLFVHNVENPVATFFIIMLASALVGYIPIKIAYAKQTKHRRGIYFLSAMAMSIASPIISIIAILWACCDKKINPATEKNNKRPPMTGKIGNK